MITLNSKQYIESKYIRVFPCAYRGYYNADKTLVFDPEARATTEANFTNTFHKLSDNKESYVIAWVPDSATDIDGTGTLKCVIGGYYFEIYNHRMNNFFYPDPKDASKLKPYYLCIKTESISLGTSEPDSTNARTTEVLSSFAESTNYLDIKDTHGRYAFTGLLISKTADANGSATASLAPFIAIPNGTGSYDYKIDSTKLPITNLLDVGSGNYSIRMIEDDTEQGSNTTIAAGDYSVALGLKTKATGEASTALGNSTTASGYGALATGNNTEASGANAVALGSNTKAEADNQVVIGAYNEKDDNQVFIVANGTADDNRSNKFTVSKNGDVKALGTLETNGSIKATGDSNNDLELGTPSAGSSGSIKVYGAGEAEAVFTVKNTGKTTISGATTITNATESTSTSTGALKVTGGVGIAKNLNVGGAAEVAKNLNVDGEFSVAANKATTLGGSLTTKGNTTLEGTLTTKLSTTLNDTLSVERLTTLKAGAKITGNVEVNGNIKVTGKATSAEKTTAEDTDITLTTKSYVDAAKTAADTYTDTEIEKLAVDAPNIADDDTGNKGDGAYLKTISQTGGKIEATKVKFATTFDTVDNFNAPTTLATDTHIRDVISNLWKDDLVKNPNGTPDKVSLQALILDAIYPIGSIYMQYVDSKTNPPEKCPLETTLTNSKWELIENGLFLRAASNADHGKTGGSADAVIIQHTHKYNGEATATAAKDGGHTHSVTFNATKVGVGNFTGFEGNAGENIKGSVTTTTTEEGKHDHQISVTLPPIGDIDTAETRVETSGKDKNLPPYLNVYMWKRIS